MPKEKKVSKHILAAEKAYHDLVNASNILRNQQKIANQPLPKHKQKKFDTIVTQCMVKERNANEVFEHAIGKLTETDEVILKKRLGLMPEEEE